MKTSDWEHLPFFLALARAGSLRAAAELLNTSYGTVNRNISALEHSYGARLFQRSQRGFSLTEFGERLLPIVEEIEKSIGSARKRVEGMDKSEAGTIRFTLTPTLAYDVMAPIIGRFHAKYPGIDIDLSLNRNIESIPNNEADVSLRAAETVNDDVIAQKLFRLKLGVYASERYVHDHVARFSERGEGLNWIGYDEDADGSQGAHPFPLARNRHRVRDGFMRACLMEQHCGMSYMPTLTEQTFPTLCRVPGTGLFDGPWLWILLHSDLQKTVRVRRFVDFLRQELLSLNRAL
ncbi:LysR family transcriptional regulator [Aliiroseovarius halocynthiae]|uniref:LysR family transcriptional regulator n=1 Tax=Aliiroseovarius halocynthiae TaxID=985055 RepID=A0A545SXA0_9RHOB|nr:LysR family transcriptional regulator [Aliiroseovarius halocynthiae]